MAKQVSLHEATKSDDWKVNKERSVNIGDESFRVYESEKTGEVVIQDGKNVGYDLSVLRGEK
jgi:hypothetical protein